MINSNVWECAKDNDLDRNMLDFIYLHARAIAVTLLRVMIH